MQSFSVCLQLLFQFKLCSSSGFELEMQKYGNSTFRNFIRIPKICHFQNGFTYTNQMNLQPPLKNYFYSNYSSLGA